MNSEFSKKDLRDGDKLTMRDGRVRFISNGEIFEDTDDGDVPVNHIDQYNENLADKFGQSFLDIMKIERQSTTTIFKRVEPIVLVKGEIYDLDDRVFRFNGRDEKGRACALSQLIGADTFYMNTMFLTLASDSKTATSTQKAALITAEIENGYLWDDKSKSLIKFK